jgi:phosphopantetheinyl transferase
MRPPDPGAAMALLVRCPAVMPPTGTLSPGERERLRSFANRRAAIDFAAGRVVLRDVLGKFTGGPPDRVGLVLRAGRPVLSPNPLGLDVSLSHGGGYLCLAIARGLAVGADIENIPAPEGLARWPRLSCRRANAGFSTGSRGRVGQRRSAGSGPAARRP